MSTLDLELHLRSKKMNEWKVSEARIRTVLELVQEVVEGLYGGSIQGLLENAHRAGENARFAAALTSAMDARPWKASTKAGCMVHVRRVLRELGLPDTFASSLRLNKPKALYNPILGKRHGAPDSRPDVKARLESWILILREETGSKTDVSLRTIMTFYMGKCLPQLGLELEQWPDDAVTHVERVLMADPSLVLRICGEAGFEASKKRATWLRVLLLSIIGTCDPIPASFFAKSRTRTDCQPLQSDVHRISSEHLERLYEASRANTRDELQFLLFITTGLRLAGVARIQVHAVTDVEGGEYRARMHGRTWEKGAKWASFMLTTRVQELVLQWLNECRPADSSPYLFPGVTGAHISTETIRANFKKVCERACLCGREFHVHSLRHTFAHILLETGNSVDIVSKCLNHTSTKTTEQFYLKENIEEVTSRAVIPWLADTKAQQKKRHVLPAFLDSGQKEEAAQTQVVKRQRMESALAKLGLA